MIKTEPIDFELTEELFDKWIKLLRSGGYKKTNTTFRDGDGCYCVLAILIEAAQELDIVGGHWHGSSFYTNDGRAFDGYVKFSEKKLQFTKDILQKIAEYDPNSKYKVWLDNGFHEHLTHPDVFFTNVNDLTELSFDQIADVAELTRNQLF